VTLWFDHTRTQIKDSGLFSDGKPTPISIGEDKREYNEWPLEWYCLPILQEVNGEDRCYSGLMLEATKDGIQGHFRRVSHFTVGQGKYGNPKFPGRYSRFVNALQDPKCWARRLVFEPTEQKIAINNPSKDKLYITLV
jgi:hypothetical protein